MIIKKTTPLNINNYIKSLYLLMKPRVMSLVIFTCAVGLLTSNLNINIADAMIGITLVALGAGAAGCLNMWYESDLDALMTRTCLRPIPTGKINRNQALTFGIVLSVISVVALNYFANFLSASLLLFTIFFLSSLSIQYGLKGKHHKTLLLVELLVHYHLLSGGL